MIKRELLRYAFWSTWATGLPRLMARRHAGQGGILSFHRVLPHSSQTFASQAVPVTPETFRSIVQTLADRGYRFLSMSGLADWLARMWARIPQRDCPNLGAAAARASPSAIG